MQSCSISITSWLNGAVSSWFAVIIKDVLTQEAVEHILEEMWSIGHEIKSLVRYTRMLNEVSDVISLWWDANMFPHVLVARIHITDTNSDVELQLPWCLDYIMCDLYSHNIGIKKLYCKVVNNKRVDRETFRMLVLILALQINRHYLRLLCCDTDNWVTVRLVVWPPDIWASPCGPSGEGRRSGFHGWCGC